MEAVNNQDEAYVEHENAKVLDVANVYPSLMGIGK